jgi:hypothetical protein
MTEMVELRNGTTITLAEYEKAKTERRRASAKQAAKTRAKNAAESEIRRAFLEKFEDCNFGGIMHAWVYPAMARIDIPYNEQRGGQRDKP